MKFTEKIKIKINPATFCEIFISRNTVNLELKGKKEYKIKRNCWIPQSLLTESRMIKLLLQTEKTEFCKIGYKIHNSEDGSRTLEGEEKSQQDGTKNHRERLHPFLENSSKK